MERVAGGILRLEGVVKAGAVQRIGESSVLAAFAEEEVLPAGAVLAQEGVFLLLRELPAGGGDADLQVPALDEHALVVLVEPLEEKQVFEPRRHGKGARGLASPAARDLRHAVGGGHDARVAALQGGDGIHAGLVHLRQGIVEVHAASRDVPQEVSDQLDAHGLLLAGEVQHARDQPRHLIREVTAKDRGFETNYHFQKVL